MGFKNRPQFPDGQIGPTGRHPLGRLVAHDEGELKFSVGHSDGGRVVVQYGRPVEWFALGPEEARTFAAALINHADAADIAIAQQSPGGAG